MASEGWLIGLARLDKADTTEAEETAAMAAAGITGTERLNPGGWIATIPDALATLEGSDIEVTVDGIEWIIEIPGV